jgi:YHS domain-containing protein
MKHTALTLCTLLTVALFEGCTRSTAAPRQDVAATDIQNIDTTPAKPAVLDPPPVLTDEAGSAPKPKPDPASTTTTPVAALPEDEAMRASLPYSPAIGLDPVNGMKISLKANTPFVEYKNHLYYFTAEDTKKTFLANPEQYTKGIFAH